MAYILQGQKCGTVFFNETGTVTGESQSYSAKATENPIEDGSDINDHAVLSARTMQITGIVVNGLQALANLERMWEERDLITYTGKFSFPTSIITSFSPTASVSNANGAGFTLTLQEVKIAVAKKVKVANQSTMSDTDRAQNGSSQPEQSKEQSNKGRQTASTQGSSASAYQSNYVDKFNSKQNTGGSSSSNKSYSGMTKN